MKRALCCLALATAVTACHRPDDYLLSPALADQVLSVTLSSTTLPADGISRATITATALAPIVNRGSRRGYLRVVLEARRGRWGARLTGEQGSGILRSMVSADGLAVVPGDTSIPIGDNVEVIVLREVSS